MDDEYYKSMPTIDGKKVDVGWLNSEIDAKKHKRGWLIEWCREGNLTYSKVKQSMYRYRQKLKVEEIAANQIKNESKIKHNPADDSIFSKSRKKSKNKIIMMNDIDKWLKDNPDNIITIRMTQKRKNNRKSIII